MMEFVSMNQMFEYRKKYYTQEVERMTYEERVAYYKECERLEKNAKHMQEQGELCAELYHIFPKEKVRDIVFNHSFKELDRKIKNVYTVEYLPLHLYDDNWLISYVSEVMKKHRPNAKISLRELRNFVKNSIAFASIRRQFVRALTGAQAEYMITAGISNALMKDSTTPFMKKNSSYFDLNFRKDVMQVMSSNGVFKYDVEVGLEESADLWRKKSMIIAFENKYYPLAEVIKDRQEFSLWWKALTKLKQAHQEVWLQRREYDYYQMHYQIIDDLGLATKTMKMNKLDLIKLDAKLKFYEKMRNMMLSTKKRRSLKNTVLKGLKSFKAKNEQLGITDEKNLTK